MDDSRPDMYKYYDQLMIHLNNNESVFFNNKLVYPRQLEIHLPANHIRSCNLNCPYCAGRYFTKKLGNWELDALEPQYLVDLILNEIINERDDNKWQEAIKRQEIERSEIDEVIKNWRNNK